MSLTFFNTNPPSTSIQLYQQTATPHFDMSCVYHQSTSNAEISCIQEDYQARLNRIAAQFESRNNIGYAIGTVCHDIGHKTWFQYNNNQDPKSKYDFNWWSPRTWYYSATRYLGSGNYLTQAIAFRDYEALEEFVIVHDVNEPDPGGRLPMDFVLQLGNPQALKILLDSGAKVDPLDIMLLLQYQHIELLEPLLEKIDVNASVNLEESNHRRSLHGFVNGSTTNHHALHVYQNTDGLYPLSKVKTLSDYLFYHTVSLDKEIEVTVLESLVNHGLDLFSKKEVAFAGAVDFEMSLIDALMIKAIDDNAIEMERFIMEILDRNVQSSSVQPEPLNSSLLYSLMKNPDNLESIEKLVGLGLDLPNWKIKSASGAKVFTLQDILIQLPSGEARTYLYQYKNGQKNHSDFDILKRIKPKNVYTTQFEDVIVQLVDSKNTITYRESVNDYGNIYFNPVINGVEYPMFDIITQMNWEQVEFTVDQTKEFNKFLYENSWFRESSIYRYTTGASFTYNAFLKGETYFWIDTLYNFDLDGPNKKSINDVNFFWIQNAVMANDLRQLAISEPSSFVCRGQGTYDRLARLHHPSFISTSGWSSTCNKYTKGETVLFETQSGRDIASTSRHGNSISELVHFPKVLNKYSQGAADGHQLLLLDELPSTNPSSSSFLHTMNLWFGFGQSPYDYTRRFQSVIYDIVRGTKQIATQTQMNRYGQMYFDVIIDGEQINMYDLITKMDWSLLSLDDDTLHAFENSLYKKWDMQSYTTGLTWKSSVDIVRKPIQLSEINSKLSLTSRSALSGKVPKCTDSWGCSYDKLYADLSDVDKGLIFQYTSASSKPLNSFLKGYRDQFEANLPLHTRRWHAQELDVKQPLHWWVYSARVANALNKIRPTRDSFQCRGQTHQDRYVRYDHPASISTSGDLNTCLSYNKGYKEGQLVLVDNPHGKDITGLSFHPDQQEYLSPPAFLRQYKATKEVETQSNYPGSVLRAKVVSSSLNS